MLKQASAAALMPTSRRPIPLRRREDLEIVEIPYRDEISPVVKDPVGLKYYRLQPEQYAILKLVDGSRSIDQVRDDLQAEFPTTHVTPSDVQSLLNDLHEKGLLISERFGQGESLLKKHREDRVKKIRQTSMNPLYLKLPGWDPENLLTKLDPWFGWIFDPPALIVAMLFVMCSWLFLAMRFDDVLQKLPEFQQFFGWPNLIFLWLTMAGAKVLHEFGHGISCRHYGGECHSMGVMLLVFSPTLYCDVTDSWMMKNKWHRIMIAAAGMYVEIVLAAFAIFFWYFSQPGMLNHLALNVFFVSTVTTVIFNANPLLRYDGYYMLSDFLEIPNLRPKATKLLNAAFSWYCLGIETPPDPFMPATGRGWFILFAIASSLYRWVVLFGITFFLYTVLKPYRLQSIGIMLAIGSVSAIFVGMITNVYQMISRPRNEPMSKIKILLTLTILGALIAGILRLPVPWYEEAALTLQPVHVRHVYTVIPGTLEEILVEPDQHVEAGQMLARLQSDDLADRRDEVQHERDLIETEPEFYRQLGDSANRLLSEQRILSLDEQLADLDVQLLQTRVVAPISGRVVAPARTPRPSVEQSRQSLPKWNGSPLQEKNLGAFLEPPTHICSIAPEEGFEAVLFINQADRGDLAIGSKVRLKLDELPGQIFDGTVREFSDRHLDFAPPALSNKYGGPLPTVTDEQGRERLQDRVYQALVEFECDPDVLRTGMRGKARFVVEERTAADWIWRWFRQTFHFRI